MKMNFLKGISPEIKKDFLAKLASGKYLLLEPYEPKTQVLNFNLIPGTDLFLCEEDGRKLTEKEIDSLQGYGLCIAVVDKTEQARHEKPPTRIIVSPHMQHQYLESLLQEKPEN